MISRLCLTNEDGLHIPHLKFINTVFHGNVMQFYPNKATKLSLLHKNVGLLLQLGVKCETQKML